MEKELLPLRTVHHLSTSLSSLIQKMWKFLLLLGGHIQRETRKYLSESIYSSIFRPSILHSYSCFSRREAHKGATACPTTPSIVCCSSWGKVSVWELVPWDRDSICRQEHATLYREPPRHPWSLLGLEWHCWNPPVFLSAQQHLYPSQNLNENKSNKKSNYMGTSWILFPWPGHL